MEKNKKNLTVEQQEEIMDAGTQFLDAITEITNTDDENEDYIDNYYYPAMDKIDEFYKSIGIDSKDFDYIDGNWVKKN